jgi:hypothetical protein
MSGPKRNPDKLNTIGVVVVGICGAVLVYVTIVALQAFYMNDTSEVQTMADYGGQDTAYKSLRATQIGNIAEYAPNSPPQGGKGVQTFRMPIDRAIKLVADGAKADPGNLVPTQGRSDRPTIDNVFGRPKAMPSAAPAGGAGSAAAPAEGTTVPMTPTGGLGPGGGPAPGTSQTAPSGGTAASPDPTGAQTPTPTAGAQSLPKATTPPAAKPGAGPAAVPKKPGATPTKAGSAAPLKAEPKTGGATGSAAKGNAR